MKTLLFGLLGLIASIYLVESLTCNRCTVGLVGYCASQSKETCTGNNTSCYTGKAVFPSISNFKGFNTQGCLATADCNATSSGTVLGARYEVSYACCSTDNCNPIQLNAASSTYVSTTMALAAALLTSIWAGGVF
ncbi:hypothetical protein ACEWY4_024377 [Coilia grayii]|uniref:UPAR/Ly6 domain-containing protein n=1 Tax=Coilia grayii TaxID=363190 RepID=A0ABD1J073_9TELE